MKYVLRALLLLIVAMMFAGCDSDGENYMLIAYQTTVNDELQYIQINDLDNHNGVYSDEKNNRIYCQVGDDEVITLPTETQWVLQDSPAIEIDVEAICLMGQEKFDKFVELFDLVTEP